MTDSKRKKLITVLAIAAAAVVIGFLLRDKYISLLLCTMGIYTIAVSGLDILFGYTGQISFGHAGFYAIGSYTAAILATQYKVTPLLGILAGAILSGVFGVIVAFPASKLVKHFLSLMTIAFGQIVYTFIAITDSLTNGFSGIKMIPPVNIFGYKLISRQSYFAFVAVILIILLFAKYRIINSRTGRALIAVRENPQAANGIGINVQSYKIISFSVSAFYTGLAGGLYAHLILFISPDTFTATQSTLFMTILLFGGLGSFIGPIIGAVVLTLVQIVLQSFSIYQQLVYAAFILLTLFFMPNGVQGLAIVIINRIKKAYSKKKVSADVKA